MYHIKEKTGHYYKFKLGRKLTELPTCIFILVPEPIMGGIAYMSVFHALLGTPSILPCIL